MSVLVAVLVVRSGGGGDPTPVPTSDAVRLEPVTYRNPAPFTPSVVASDARGLAGRVAGSTTAELPAPTGTVTGDAEHLYASTGDAPVCDKAALAARLRGSSRVAAAWAAASGVEPAAIDGLLATLTPVVLRADTAVTNHIYRSGDATAYQAVLEAGTPVMVDPTGLPRVQCSCGNPLLAPAAQRPARTDGTAWRSYQSKRVVSVTPAPAPLPAIRTVDLDTSKPATTATGSNTRLDGTLVSAADGLHVATPDGTVVKVLDEPVKQVFDDGRGGLVYMLGTPSELYGNPGSERAATIWHLPAGAAEAVALVPPAQPGGWNELEAVGRLGDRTYVVFGRLHEEPPFEGADPAGFGDLVSMDIDSKAESTLLEGAYGWESGVSSASLAADRLSVVEVAEIYASWKTFGPGPAEIANQCMSEQMIEIDVSASQMPCPAPGVLDESGKFVGIDEPQDEAAPMTVVWTDPVTGEKGRGTALTGPRPDDSRAFPVQVRAGRLITATYVDKQRVWRMYDLSNGAPVDLPVDGLDVRGLWTLTAPLIRPQAAPAPPSTAPSTTSPAAYRAVTVEELRAGFPSAVCGVDAGPVAIGPEGYGTNGADPDHEVYVRIGFEDQAVAVDVDGDGLPETVVSAVCSTGGNGYSTPLAVLRATPNGIEIVGEVDEDYWRSNRVIDAVAAIDGGVQVSGKQWADGDGTCCPSETFTTRLRFVNGSWQEF